MNRTKNNHKELFFLPIEDLEERYSKQWNVWFKNEFDQRGMKYRYIHPQPLRTEIKDGAFLDVIGTHYFKSMQIAEVCRILDTERDYLSLLDQVLIFVEDGWFPGIESLFYIRQALKMWNLKFVALFHAGTYDHADFLYRLGMEPWGEHLERSWMVGFDKILLSVPFHKELLLKMRDVPGLFQKISLVGLPMDTNACIIESSFVDTIKAMDDHTNKVNYEDVSHLKENIVLFPHRKDPEKKPYLFKLLESCYRFKYPMDSIKFIFTRDKKRDKKEYHDLLLKTKVALSFATQETFGISMVEAYNLGAHVIVPERLAYKDNFLWNDDEMTVKGVRMLNTLDDVMVYPDNDDASHIEEICDYIHTVINFKQKPFTLKYLYNNWAPRFMRILDSII